MLTRERVLLLEGAATKCDGGLFNFRVQRKFLCFLHQGHASTVQTKQRYQQLSNGCGTLCCCLHGCSIVADRERADQKMPKQQVFLSMPAANRTHSAPTLARHRVQTEMQTHTQRSLMSTKQHDNEKEDLKQMYAMLA